MVNWIAANGEKIVRAVREVSELACPSYLVSGKQVSM